jgi:DNA-binding transcriptional ArsR family regulator
MFQNVATREPVKITDPKAIRALAHPARLAVIDELYSGAELTATECAQLSGLTPSAMSYHLRSLEKVGIVERVEHTGDGRERPWRAAGAYLQVESQSVAEAATLGTILLSRLSEQFAAYLARRNEDSKEWQEASIVGSGRVWLRPEELAEINSAIDKLIDHYRDRVGTNHPPDARRVRFSIFAFPSDAPEVGSAE